MESLKLNCYQLFAAIQYVPLIEILVKEKQKIPDLNGYYDLVLQGINGMYDLRNTEKFRAKFPEKLPQEFDVRDPNFARINHERIEIQQTINLDEEINGFIERLENLHSVHTKLFNNKVIKLGFIKFYEVVTEKNIFEKLYNINAELIDSVDNAKTFYLVKEKGYNINVEISFKVSKYFLRVDINDITTKEKYFEWSHFDDIIQLHNDVIKNQLLNYIGIKNV